MLQRKILILLVSLLINILNVYADFKESGYYPRKPTCLRPHLHRGPSEEHSTPIEESPRYELDLYDPRLIDNQRKGVSNFFKKDKEEEIPFEKKRKSPPLLSI